MLKKEATLDLAKNLIARPSMTPDDGGCQELLIERLQNLGFIIHRLPFDDVVFDVHDCDY